MNHGEQGDIPQLGFVGDLIDLLLAANGFIFQQGLQAMGLLFVSEFRNCQDGVLFVMCIDCLAV